jgi:hypothetical protein
MRNKILHKHDYYSCCMVEFCLLKKRTKVDANFFFDSEFLILVLFQRPPPVKMVDLFMVRLPLYRVLTLLETFLRHSS